MAAEITAATLQHGLPFDFSRGQFSGKGPLIKQILTGVIQEVRFDNVHSDDNTGFVLDIPQIPNNHILNLNSRCGVFKCLKRSE